MLNFFPVGGAGGGSIALDLAHGPTLPLIVVDRRIFVVTTDPVPNWHVSTEQPLNPAPGDLWLQVAQGGEVLTVSNTPPYFSVGLVGAWQYVGGVWGSVDGYIGVLGLWEQLSMSLPPVGTPLENYSWAQIDYVSQNGEANVRFAIAGTKNFVVGGVNYVAEIVGFAHDDLADGSGKAGITFGLQNCLNTMYPMNNTDTNANGWGGSVFRGTLQNSIKNQIENDLKTIIKPVYKKASAGNQSATILTSTDELFLFSEIEVFGARTYSHAGEGAQYPRFSTAATRIKKVNGTNSIWRLRSPFSTYSTYFCAVDASGPASGGGGASVARGAAFGFCV